MWHWKSNCRNFITKIGTWRLKRLRKSPSLGALRDKAETKEVDHDTAQLWALFTCKPSGFLIIASSLLIHSLASAGRKSRKFAVQIMPKIRTTLSIMQLLLQTKASASSWFGCHRHLPFLYLHCVESPQVSRVSSTKHVKCHDYRTYHHRTPHQLKSLLIHTPCVAMLSA